MAEFETEDFIKMMKENPMLWDRSDLNYKNIKKKAAAWKKISSAFGIGVELAKKKWKRLRNSYTREMNVRGKRSGQSTLDPTNGWRFYEQLEFLKDCVKPKALTSNYEDDDHNFGGGNSSSQEAGPSTSQEINFPILSTELVFSPGSSADEADFSMSCNDSRRSQFSLRDTDEGSSAKQRKTEISLEETILRTLDSLQSYLTNKSDPATTSPATTTAITGASEDELFCQSLVRKMQKFPLRVKNKAKSQMLTYLNSIENSLK